MKIKSLLIATIATGLIFTSCEKEKEVSKPVISSLELGIDNSKVAYIGGELHMDAEIVAEGKIALITVKIHPESGEGEEIEITYTEYAGLKNTDFHKHVDIPSEFEPGEYHFHLVVTDQEGNQTSVEDDITIMEAEDE